MIPSKYIGPLSRKDKKIQKNMILRSRRLYAKGEYYTRKPLASYKNKTSKHILKAERIYGVKIAPTKELSLKTGCPVSALKAVVRKGEGAYYSSGSRPNQTPQSWGFARLASSLTAGKSAAVDYDIIRDGCNHNKKAFILANRSRKKYGYGHSRA